MRGREILRKNSEKKDIDKFLESKKTPANWSGFYRLIQRTFHKFGEIFPLLFENKEEHLKE